MSTPSIKVGQGNWGIKAGNLLAYANTDKKFVAREFTVGRLLDTATRVNASGNIEGVLANVPRIDYFGGQASLLVEPSAQNLSLNSQTWDASNNWELADGSGRVTVVTATSGTLAPDGLSTANAISPTSGNITHYLYSSASASIPYVSGTVYTISAFFKKGAGNSGRYVQIASVGGRFIGNPYANFDLELGTTATVSGSAADSNRTSRIQNYGNGWYRCSLTATCNNSGLSTISILVALLTADINARTGTAFEGNTSDYIFGWGAQLETGSVATSYIPTTTGTVTRNADVISLTGVAGLIGQTEGTIYAEINYNRTATTKTAIMLINTDGSFQNRIQLYTDSSHQLNAIFSNAATAQTITASGTNLQNGINKIALTYTSASAKLFLNGALQQSFVLTIFPAASLQVVKLGNNFNNSLPIYNGLTAAELYTTMLSDAELQSITTL